MAENDEPEHEPEHHKSGGLGASIQKNPGIVIAGAVGVGLLFMLSRGGGGGGGGSTPEAIGIPQGQPNEPYLTVEEFNSAMGDYDDGLRQYIQTLINQGGSPLPPPSGPNQCPPGYHWAGGQCVPNGSPPGGGCEEGMVYSPELGMCVPALPGGGGGCPPGYVRADNGQCVPGSPPIDPPPDPPRDPGSWGIPGVRY